MLGANDMDGFWACQGKPKMIFLLQTAIHGSSTQTNSAGWPLFRRRGERQGWHRHRRWM